MEIELRIILLIVGVIILIVAGADLYRRRPAKEILEIEPVLDNAFNSVQHEAKAVATVSEAHSIDFEFQTELEPIPENVLTITIRSRDAYGFKGANLLNAIKNAHLHFGKNDVFYRYENDNGQGEVLFMLVKATEPGYFYLETLLQEHIPGVIVMLLADKVRNPKLALDQMVRTAKQMAFVLNAELLDEKRQPLTLETIERYKRQVQ